AWIGGELLPRPGENRFRIAAVESQETMRSRSEAVARLSGVDDADASPRPPEIDGGGEPGEGAPHDDDVIFHGWSPERLIRRFRQAADENPRSARQGRFRRSGAGEASQPRR